MVIWIAAAAAPASSSLRFIRDGGGGYRCRAEAIIPSHLNDQNNNSNNNNKKKVVVVGSGWAGLASAHHLSKQGFDVTVLEPAGSCPAEEVGIRGFWTPYRNIFAVVDELGLQPFTEKTRSALYSSEGLEVEFPIFQDLPRLPTPLGALVYPQVLRLSLADRLTSLPLIAPVIDFDNTDTAWRKYDAMTARELFKQYGCSERLYREAFKPLLHAGLFAPPEQCSAAATLGMLYYYIFAHQQNFDVLWCRGTVRDKIFIPWLESLKAKGCKFLENKRVTDFVFNEDSGCISGVVVGQEKYDADAFVVAVGVSTLQSTIMSSSLLQLRPEFLNVLNMAAIDVVSVKVWLDRKYFANQLLPLKDEQIVAKLMSNLSRCIKEFEEAVVLQQTVVRLPRSATHFFPGSYKYMMRGSTTFPNLFMAGDWIVNRHGSWSQEKAYVTGLEAANRVIDYFGEGDFAKIVPVEDDEAHIEALRELNRRVSELRSQIPLSDFFLS